MTARFRHLLLLLGALLAFPLFAIAQTAGFEATVTSASADLRKNASATAVRVETVSKGTKLPAYGLSPDKKWVNVKGPEGKAWISRSDVTLLKAGAAAAPTPADDGFGDTSSFPSSTPTKTPKPTPTKTTSKGSGSGIGGAKKYATVVVPKTKILLNATKSAPTVAVANKGDEFEVSGLSKTKEWVKVKTDDGRIGWILKTDVKPGRSTPVAVAEATPKPRATAEVAARPAKTPKPPKPPKPIRSRRKQSDDMRVWADGGVVLIHEKVTSREGHGYDLNGMGFGGGVRFEKPMTDSIILEGGYLGTANQRVRAPESSTTVFSTLHRFDVTGRYRYNFGGDPDGASVSALLGFQNYSLLFQSQNLSWFYSQIYNSVAIGAGGEYGFSGGTLRLAGDVRYLPTIAGQRYGSGGEGGDGTSNTSSGFSAGLSIRKVFDSGASLGLAYRGHFYQTQYQGEGIRGPNRIHKVKVVDEFNAVTLIYARGF